MAHIHDHVRGLKELVIKSNADLAEALKMKESELNKLVVQIDELNSLVSQLKESKKRITLSADIKPEGYSVDPNVLLDVAVITMTGVCGTLKLNFK